MTPPNYSQGSNGCGRPVQHGRQCLSVVRSDDGRPFAPIFAASSRRDDAAFRLRRSSPPAAQSAEPPFTFPTRIHGRQQRAQWREWRRRAPPRPSSARQPQQQQRSCPGHSAVTRFDADQSHRSSPLPPMWYVPFNLIFFYRK